MWVLVLLKKNKNQFVKSYLRRPSNPIAFLAVEGGLKSSGLVQCLFVLRHLLQMGIKQQKFNRSTQITLWQVKNEIFY